MTSSPKKSPKPKLKCYLIKQKPYIPILDQSFHKLVLKQISTLNFYKTFNCTFSLVFYHICG